MVQCKPFVKWAGGKTQLLPELRSRFPREYNRYLEPFVGGGALFFDVQPRNAYLSDANPDLINAFQVVRDAVEELIKDLQQHVYEKTYYYALRDADRDPSFNQWTQVKRASRFIYLNKTCFNGLYRVNAKGQFNVPFGRYKNPTLCDEKNLRLCNQVLQTAALRCETFTDVAHAARPGDFIYFDPPYAPSSQTANFTGYSLDGFRENDQRDLSDLCRQLDESGVHFMLSNSFTPLAQELYKEFKVEVVQAARAINSKASHRGRVNELVVTNY